MTPEELLKRLPEQVHRIDNFGLRADVIKVVQAAVEEEREAICDILILNAVITWSNGISDYVPAMIQKIRERGKA